MNIKEYKELDRKLTKEEKKELFLEYYKTKDQDLRTVSVSYTHLTLPTKA